VGSATSNAAVLTVVPSPVITSAASATGVVGSAFSYTITATNSPTSYSASGLPAGLSIKTTTGAITGTPTVSGASSVLLSATNAVGTGNAVLALTINGTQPKPAITSATTAKAALGSAFSYIITASNSPTSYDASGLPSGLSVNTATGAITGTPTVSGTSSVSIGATNAGGTGEAILTLTVSPPAPVITSAASATGIVGSAFSYTITANNSPTSFNATGLPAGLTVTTATGVISGTPTATGTSSVTISAINAVGTGNAVLALTINASQSKPAITSAATATAALGSAFSYTITASNSPTSYSATGLPSGLSVNTTTGAIIGAATAAGSFNVAIGASNAGGTGTAILALTVIPHAPAITSAATATATKGSAFSYTITASNSPTSYNATGLPAGLSVKTTTGAITGTPTTSGSSSISLSATNAGGTGNAVLTLTINASQPKPAITSATTATAALGSAFSYTITASNSPTSYSATGLPSGLSVNTTTGAITGSATAAGSFNVTIGATNAGGTGTAILALTVSPPVPVITSATTYWAAQPFAFSYTITASNSPTSFNATGLPAGLVIKTTTGVISGRPTALGTFSVLISATNTHGTGSAILSLTISAEP
jgi:hypothetical protein